MDWWSFGLGYLLGSQSGDSQSSSVTPGTIDARSLIVAVLGIAVILAIILLLK